LEGHMNVEELLEKASRSIAAERVYGPPVEQDGSIVIPAAAVMGGGGGGTGEDAEGAGGSGTGFGVRAKPAGAWVIKGGEATWQPAVDVNRAILIGAIVLIIAVLARRSVAAARAR
jgi:uncharacterized spore protein YtfJ